jgi:hypothetical protein
MLVLAPIAIVMNLSEGREALPSSTLLVLPIILTIGMSPWILWWLLLRLAELTLGNKPDRD